MRCAWAAGAGVSSKARTAAVTACPTRFPFFSRARGGASVCRQVSEEMMSAIKVAEFAFPRMEAPDLDQMEEFLTHFGLVRAERTPDALYMRGTDSHHHLHVTHKGGTKFLGFAYH